uniref:(northern house mosquito) hypothetical protein n=1 Tax=Culex pipiens TaxID=7175 RepID=A0A8D8KPH2_CULPI
MARAIPSLMTLLPSTISRKWVRFSDFYCVFFTSPWACVSGCGRYITYSGCSPRLTSAHSPQFDQITFNQSSPSSHFHYIIVIIYNNIQYIIIYTIICCVS